MSFNKNKSILKEIKDLKGHFIIVGLSIDFYKKFIMQFNLVTE